MVVLSAPFSQVSGAPVAVPGRRSQSVTGGSGLSLADGRKRSHRRCEIVNRADLVGCGRSQLCQSTLKYWPFAPMLNVGEGSAGVKAGRLRRRLLAGAVALLVA